MISPPDVKADILEAVPHLRAFAISLTGDLDRADDLDQEDIMGGEPPRLLHPGHEHAGMAVHNPAQPVSYRVPQAAARGRRS
jgi:hypothetical protein